MDFRNDDVTRESANFKDSSEICVKKFRDGYEKLVSNSHDSDTVLFEQRIRLYYEFCLNHTAYECDPYVASADMRDKALCNIFSAVTK